MIGLGFLRFAPNLDKGFDILKLRLQRNPNECWGYGLGMSVSGFGVALYWIHKAKELREK